jgi:nucleotide-binding universal stress UspA family protein
MNVTIAYDGSKKSKVAIDEFSRTNWGSKMAVHVVHASLNPYAYRERLQAISESNASGHKEATLEQLNLVARQLPFTDPDPKVHLLEAEHIGQSIVDFATRSDSDIVMTGDTGQSAIDRMLLGSTSRYILRHAPMSVWIARRRETAS